MRSASFRSPSHVTMSALFAVTAVNPGTGLYPLMLHVSGSAYAAEQARRTNRVPHVSFMDVRLQHAAYAGGAKMRTELSLNAPIQKTQPQQSRRRKAPRRWRHSAGRTTALDACLPLHSICAEARGDAAVARPRLDSSRRRS